MRASQCLLVVMGVVGVLGGGTVLDEEYAEMVGKRHQMLADGVSARYGPWDLFREAWPCPGTRRYGTLGDGGKWLCFVPHNCTVLSVGIGDEISFEEALLDVHNCTVHAYDPAISRALATRPRARFSRAGVRGDARHPLARGVSGGLSVKEMLAESALERVDIFKADVEEAEFGMFAELFVDYPVEVGLPFDQLAVEFHVMEHSLDELVRVVEKLEEYGFRLFETEINPTNPQCCAELAFVHRGAFMHDLRSLRVRHGTWGNGLL
jgi:hypothetical protein